MYMVIVYLTRQRHDVNAQLNIIPILHICMILFYIIDFELLRLLTILFYCTVYVICPKNLIQLPYDHDVDSPFKIWKLCATGEII